MPFPLSDLPPLTPNSALDILIVALLIYQFLMIIRGRRAVHVLMGMGVLGGDLCHRGVGQAGSAARHSRHPRALHAHRADRHVSSPSCVACWLAWAQSILGHQPTRAPRAEPGNGAGGRPSGAKQDRRADYGRAQDRSAYVHRKRSESGRCLFRAICCARSFSRAGRCTMAR